MSNKQDLKDAVKTVLADTFVIYYKTHAFHWNVTGPRFRSLHLMFEEQYEDWFKALDDIAERLRTIGGNAPDNPIDLMKCATLENIGQTPDADEMVNMLAKDNRAIAKSLMKAIDIADDLDDEGTEDLLVERLRAHEKAAWMLESSAA